MEMILLPKGTNQRIKQLESQNQVLHYNIHSGRCIHISNEGIKCGGASRKDLANGWLCTKHQEYILIATKLHAVN